MEKNIKEENNNSQKNNEENNKKINIIKEEQKENNKLILTTESEKPKLPISKNQMKKIKKQEEWLKKMEVIKKYKKEKKKEKKRIKREQKKQEEKLNPKKPEEIKETKINKNLNIPFISRKEKKEEFKRKCKNGLKVVIDCDFEHLMNERNNKSMVRQITDLYAINRSSENPFRLILYGVGEHIKEGLKKCNCENWLGIEIYYKEEYPTFEKFIEKVLYKEDKYDKRPLKDIKNIIYYLSADSENNVENIDNNATYIIGGIVDRNKYKGLTYNKAKELGINHGKFPIGEFLKLNSSQVLTTNHTFHILNEFSIKHDWKEAFVSIIPKRKQENEEEEEQEENEDKIEK